MGPLVASGLPPSRAVAIRTDGGVRTVRAEPAVVRDAAGLPPVVRVDVERATPRAPAVVEDPARPRPSAPAERVRPAALVAPVAAETPQARINELARAVVDRMRAGDHRGALDLLHGQRGGSADARFEARFLAAARIYSSQQFGGLGFDAMLHTMPRSQRVLFAAYLRNEGGRSRPEDIAFIATEGTGTNERALNDIYADLRRQHPDDAAYRAAVTAMEARFLERYRAPGDRAPTMEADLTRGMFSELSGSDLREWRASRARAADALTVYSAGEGRTLTTDQAAIVDRLAANVHRIDAFAAEYGYVADGREGQTRARLEKMISEQLSGDAAARARALIGTGTPQERAGRYLDLTLRQYLDGRIDRAETVRAIRTVAGRGAPLSGPDGATYVNADTMRRVVSGARDPEVAAAIRELSWNQPVEGGRAAVAEFDRLFNANGGLPGFREFVRYLDNLAPEQRLAIRDAYPDIERRIDQRWAPPELRERALRAFRGETDAVDLLRYYGTGGLARLADASDVTRATMMLGARDRADFRAIFEQRFPGVSFNDALGALDTESRAAMRFALAPAMGTTRRELEGMLGQVRGILSHDRGDTGWTSVSRALTDRFSVAGDVTDDAMRGLVTAVREAAAAADAGRLTDTHREALVRAQQRLEDTLRTYHRDRADIADNAADISIGIVSVLTVGAGLTAATLLRASATAGTLNAGTRAAVLAPDYTGTQAVYDFFAGAAFEAGGLVAAQGLMVGGRIGLRALRR